MAGQEYDEQERPDLTAWRWRQALRSSNAARPKKSGREYRRKHKHSPDYTKD